MAIPTTDAAGQLAGFALKIAAGHAFCSVVSREGSCLGSSTLTFAMFALRALRAAGVGQLRVEARPVRREVFPEVETLNFGLKARPAQFVTWNGVETLALALSLLVMRRRDRSLRSWSG